MMDSYLLVDQVFERLDGEVPVIEGRPGVNVNLHAIVLATLQCLKEAGFIDLESPVDEKESVAAV